MQSTGHSSMHVLSNKSTQDSVMMYVTCLLPFRPQDRRLSAGLDAPRRSRRKWMGPSSLPAGGGPLGGGVPHVSDPVLLGVRHQPGRHRPPLADAPDLNDQHWISRGAL